MTIILGQIIFLRIHRIGQILIGIILFVLIYQLYSRLLLKSNPYRFSWKNEINNRRNFSKYIHLDLKGAPPKAKQFYPSFFEFIEKLQMDVKGVVIEYEDTLPLDGNLFNATHRFSYTKSDINLIVESARKHQLEIIPLIQTFGHLEWLLKLDEWKSYRDDQNLPTVISPCINETYILLEDLLRQTLNMHPYSKMIHIGCDEVVLTNSHRECSTKQMNNYQRYLTHIERIVEIIHRIRPRIRILIWDDIIRNEQTINHQNSLKSLKNLVEPVSWHYLSKFDEQFRYSSVWNIYPKYFSHLWTASAFKGGLHRFSMLTNTTHHVLNNQQWFDFLQSSNFPQQSFVGMILTGWSRFDHFMPLCDLFPTAYPSLIYSLHVLNTNQLLFDMNIQNCYQLLKSLKKNSDLCELLPGHSIWSNIIVLSNTLKKTQKHLKLLHTIAPEYNRRYSFVRRYELNTFLRSLKHLWNELSGNKQILHRYLTDIYYNDVINEWFDLYVNPIEREINKTIIELTPILKKIIWPRRPFN